MLEHDKDWTTWNEPNPNQITHTIYTNMHHTVQQSTRGTTVLLVSVILFIRRGVYLAPTWNILGLFAREYTCTYRTKLMKNRTVRSTVHTSLSFTYQYKYLYYSIVGLRCEIHVLEVASTNYTSSTCSTKTIHLCSCRCVYNYMPWSLKYELKEVVHPFIICKYKL